jgi:hypothetical protein
MLITIALLLCISDHVAEEDASAFARAAERRGYDVQAEDGPGCAATLFASDSDWADYRRMGFDDGGLDNGNPRPLTIDRSNDIITAWEARL